MSEPNYVERQQAQFRRFLQWVKSEGGVEMPTQLFTLLSDRQRARMDWLENHAFGRILEVGANFGMVLAWVGGHVGVEINPMNVDLARLLNIKAEFIVGDATKLPFADGSFDTVMLPEVLEHLDWPDGVAAALGEALRVTRRVVLITIPDGRKDSEDALSPKHMWLADDHHLGVIKDMLPCPISEEVSGFICMWVRKKAS